VKASMKVLFMTAEFKAAMNARKNVWDASVVVSGKLLLIFNFTFCSLIQYHQLSDVDLLGI